VSGPHWRREVVREFLDAFDDTRGTDLDDDRVERFLDALEVLNNIVANRAGLVAFRDTGDRE
jgi:hypothetical protein